MKKNKYGLIISIMAISLVVIGVTYSLIIWRSTDEQKTNVVFEINGLDGYINYSEGVAITSSDNKSIPKGFDYSVGESTTIELWKKPSASSMNLYGHIYIDITTIDPTLANEDALTWTIVSDGQELNSGNFVSKTNGDTLTIATNIQLRTTIQEFTIYLWLDEEKYTGTNLAGTSISTIIRTEVTSNEYESFDIENVSSVSPSVINIIATSAAYNITDYAITNNNVVPVLNNKKAIVSTLEKRPETIKTDFMANEPTGWISVTPTKNLNINHYVSSVGNYYVWVRNSGGEIKSSSVTVSNVDTNAPLISLDGTASSNIINVSSTVTIPIKITETSTGFDSDTFTKETIRILVNGTEVTPQNKTLTYNSETSGVYSYTLTLSGINTNGILTLVINEGMIKDKINNYNVATTLTPNITVDNLAPFNNSIVINEGNTYTNSSNLSLAISSNGASTMCISNTTTCTNYVPYATTTSYTVDSTNGEKIIYAYFKDDVGNVSEVVSSTIILDTIKPSIALNGNASSNLINSTNTITIPIKVTEVTSGINVENFTETDINVLVNGVTVTPGSKTLTYNSETSGIYSYTLTLSGITGTGSLTLTVPAASISDNANNNNNTATLTPNVTIDNTAPIISNVTADVDDQTISVTVTASDNIQLSTYWYSINGTTYYSSNNNTYNFTGLDNNTYTVSVYVNDTVNNSSLISTKDNLVVNYIEPYFRISSIKINNVTANGMPTSGFHTLASDCDNLTWNPLTKKLKVTDFTTDLTCNLNYTNSTNYPLLNTMQVGDYVAYVGNNGCMNNGTDVTGTGAAESKNSCLGWNANQTDTTNQDNYGYCKSSNTKYYVYGWRIAYIESGKVYLTTAGSPECRTRTSSTGNATGIADLNNAALDYCNSTYTGGTCSASTAWAMGNEDYKKMTLAIFGTSSNLTSAYGSPSCDSIYSKQSCGYNNSLIDNGGYYWLSAYYTTSNTRGVCWSPRSRSVDRDLTYAYGFRPIISLASTVYVTGGSGTMEDPYTIGI